MAIIVAGLLGAALLCQPGSARALPPGGGFHVGEYNAGGVGGIPRGEVHRGVAGGHYGYGYGHRGYGYPGYGWWYPDYDYGWLYPDYDHSQPSDGQI